MMAASMACRAASGMSFRLVRQALATKSRSAGVCGIAALLSKLNTNGDQSVSPVQPWCPTSVRSRQLGPKQAAPVFGNLDNLRVGDIPARPEPSVSEDGRHPAYNPSASSIPISDMHFWQRLAASARERRSLLCVGLDPVVERLPEAFCRPGRSITGNLLAWNTHIIEETAEWAAAYKPNLGFYLAHGIDGLRLLEDTLARIPSGRPVILDAKFGDIGATSEGYAQFCFGTLGVGAVTLNPYLGRDGLAPFLDWPDKGCFVLAHSSNPDGQDFQGRRLDGEPLFIQVAQTARTWGPNSGLVVGATDPRSLKQVRAAVPDRWFLAPGIGTQGGALEASLAAGWISQDVPGVLFNTSSSLVQAREPEEAAGRLVRAMQAQMDALAAT